MNKNLLIIISLVLFYGQISAQKMGQWKDYLSYKSCHKVVDGGDKVYCVSTGGLFSFNKTDNSIEKITGLNGLSDFGIHTIAYNSTLKVLVVAYNNSNIDLVYEDQVVNISDIKRKMMTADKTIHNILFVGSEAYLSCGFGIVALNLDKQEVKDTYYIGKDGGSWLYMTWNMMGKTYMLQLKMGFIMLTLMAPAYWILTIGTILTTSQIQIQHFSTWFTMPTS